MAGHVVIASYTVHSLESNRAGPISRTNLILILALFIHIERKRNLKYNILHGKNLDYAYFVSIPHGTMDWHAVCDCGISWPYTIIFETIIIVYDNTIVLHKI